MKSYFIKSERLGFGKWESKSVNQAKLLWGDTNVTKLIGGDFSEDDIMNRLNNEIDMEHQYGIQYWPIFKLESNEFIGCCGLRPYKIEDAIYEIGVHLLPKFWKQGFASEALQRVMDYAFCDIDASRLFAGHNPKNIASGRVLAKIGFQYSHDEFYPPTGLNHPSYFLSKEKFLNG